MFSGHTISLQQGEGLVLGAWNLLQYPVAGSAQVPPTLATPHRQALAPRTVLSDPRKLVDRQMGVMVNVVNLTGLRLI